MSVVATDLSVFEKEIYSILKDEGPVEYIKGGSWTLCELLGYANDKHDEVWRAIRQLCRVGLIVKHATESNNGKLKKFTIVAR